MKIEFDAEKHQYYVDENPVPSVTQICAPLGADYDEPDDDMLELTVEAAADRGATMHAYIEYRLSGGEPEDFELPSQYQGYADAVELFLAEHTITPYGIEQPIACEYYAGTPDLTCEFDGFDSILDWKFVSQIAKSKVAGQLGGYLDLCEYNDYFPSRLYAVQFLKDGTYRLYPVDFRFATQAFGACHDLYGMKCKKHPRGRIG
ncbi:MAG: hypothetical protein IJU66_00050 [Oscillospiraceae bacterium]|nr:hypothetical protein [Oscillospiraceae bacterium]